MSGAPIARAHRAYDADAFDYVCIDCERIERRASAIVAPYGWRRTDEGVVCSDCARGAPARLVELNDREILAAMTEEVAAATGLAPPIAAHIATGILLGFRYGSPAQARGMALIGAADARLVAREALASALSPASSANAGLAVGR